MMPYDLVIKNSKIVDGTGNPWFWGDLGIKDGKINYIGKIPADVKCSQVIDAAGKVLSPGFIDCHCHSDFLLLRDSVMESKLKQGVTTQMIGPCGLSPAPIKTDKIKMLDKYAGFLKAGVEPSYEWRSFGDYLNALEKLDLGTNIGAYVGQGTIRINVMGFEIRKPKYEELEEMKNLLREAMVDGAFGMSSGLIYPPGVYSEPDEIVELAKVLKDYNGVYVSHIRNESDNLLNAVKEIIDVAEKGRIPCQIHHHKACGKKNWGLVRETIKLMEDARMRGLDITIDQYPYTSASTTLRAILPPWAQEGGISEVINRLKDEKTREKIIKDILTEGDWENFLYQSGGPEGVLVVYVPSTPVYEGKTLEEIGNMMEKDPVEAALDLIVLNNGSDNACYFMMSEDDVKYVMKNQHVMIGSDSIPVAPGAKCHPRTNGTFPRILGKYVREEHTLTLEDAVRKMTSFPASRFNIENKGIIKKGMDADIVIFNPDTVIDNAVFKDPFKEPDGIEYVIINGRLVINNGEYTGIKEGKVLRKSI
jgi:N-acyl-D-amino-acid deacylase